MIVNFTLDDYYEVHDLDNELVYRGTYLDIRSTGVAASVFGLSEAEVISLRQRTVTDVINKELLRINEHNNFTKSIGVGYEFFIPEVSSSFSNAISEPGILSVIQGLGSGAEKINVFNMAVASITISINVEGYDNAGRLVYYEETDPNKVGTYIETFDSKKEAAKAGYHPVID